MALAAWTAAAFWVPPLVLVAAGIGAVLALAHGALHLRAVRRTAALEDAALEDADVEVGERAFGLEAEPLPFVSVHVPICNEPPALVCRTLSALTELEGRFEVVVLDNNTADRALWEPVRDHCLALGRRFRFRHVDALEGAKAGALTVCLAMADRRASHVLVVDADYAVTPDLLVRAGRAWARGQAEGRRVGAVQFPQAYANTAGAEGLAHAYRRYFDRVLAAADAERAALLTGTLSVVGRDALEAAGGWSAATITEDADLGARLHRAGYDVVYDPARVGRGLMPSDLCALRSQRRRWACGNVQTLRRGARGAAVWHQLTFWTSPLALPLLVLVTVAALGLEAEASRWAAGTAAATAAGWLAARFAVLAVGAGPDVAARAWLSERGLAWEAMTAGWEGALGVRLPFVRTSKDLGSGRVRGAGPGVALALAVVLTGLVLALRGAPLAGAATVAVGAVFGAGLAALVRELSGAARSAVPVHARAAARMARGRSALAS